MSKIFESVDISSYYQARVAQVFVDSALNNIVAKEDPELLEDITLLAGHFLKPVQDSKAYSAEELYEEGALKSMYEVEEHDRALRHQAFDTIIQKYVGEPEKLRRLTQHVARLGHLVKLAAPHSHENVMDDSRPKRKNIFDGLAANTGADATNINFNRGIPDSLEQYIFNMVRAGVSDGATFRDAVAQAAVASVSSAHPTRYLTPDFTDNRLQFALSARELTRCSRENQTLLTDFVNGQGKAFEGLQRWFQTPITFTDAAGGPANMTPLDEIIASMHDARDDFTRQIGEIYRTYDDAMRRLSDAKRLPWEHDANEQRLFKLSLHFATWVMGDKDGNLNLRSEHFALGVLMFRHMGAGLYAAEMKAGNVTLPGAPDGGNWQTYFENKQQEMNALLEPLLRRIAAEGKGIDLPMSRAEFKETLKAMKAVYGDIEKNETSFQASLNDALDQGGDNTKPLLSMLRKSRIFGLGIMKFHMRETADEYQTVVGNLLRHDTGLFASPVDYASLEDDQKLALLNLAMKKDGKNPGTLAKVGDAFFERLEKEGKNLTQLRDYSPENPDVITAHTLQRFEVATLQKGLVTDHILAECQGAVQMLETLLVAKITGIQLTIAPLLEEHETLTQAIPIFKDAFEQRAWRDHMWDMADGDPTAIINLLKVQFAHSDNMRRMGLPAARANIYDQANLLLPGAKEMFPRILELYAQDGRVKREDIPKILKQMDEKPNAYHIRQFHGGSRCDTARGGIRAATAFADDTNTHNWFEGTDQGGDNPELRLGDRFKRLLTTLTARNSLEMLKARNGNAKVWNFGREQKIRAAIDRTIKDYTDNHYGADNQIGRAMGEAGFYELNTAYNNPGSRGARNASGGVKAVEVNINPVDPSKIRTIGFTSTGLDMGLGYGALPMRKMMRYINELYQGDEALRDELQASAPQFFGAGHQVFADGKLTPAGIHTLYRVSPIYRAAASDFPGYAVGISDPQLTVDLLRQRESRGGPAASNETLDYFNSSVPKDIVGDAVPFLAARKQFVPESFISQKELDNPTAETCRKLTFLVRKLGMETIDEQMGLGERFHHFARMVREGIVNETWRTKPKGERKLNDDQAYAIRMAGVLRSVFGHVLYDGVLDNGIGNRRIKQRPDREYWVPALPLGAAVAA